VEKRDLCHASGASGGDLGEERVRDEGEERQHDRAFHVALDDGGGSGDGGQISLELGGW